MIVCNAWWPSFICGSFHVFYYISIDCIATIRVTPIKWIPFSNARYRDVTKQFLFLHTSFHFFLFPQRLWKEKRHRLFSINSKNSIKSSFSKKNHMGFNMVQNVRRLSTFTIISVKWEWASHTVWNCRQ